MGREYKFYATTPPSQRSKGGTAVAIKKKITQKRLNIRTTIQVVALEVYLIGKGKRTVCSFYLPLTDQMTKEDMRDLLEQLPAPMILLGDFNTHNLLWGSEKMYTRGRMMEKVLIRYNILYINKKEETY